jgi:hypothetical protein
MWVVHRRGGKDLTAMHQTVKEAPSTRSLLACLPDLLAGPQSDLGRLHQRRQADHRSGVPARDRQAAQRARDVRGAALRIYLALLGSDKIEVVGAGPVGVVFSEYAVAKPRAADLISPMLMENNGWESYITTPRGRNHAFKLYNAAKKIRAGSAKCRPLRYEGL